jgi:hypothetical protein
MAHDNKLELTEKLINSLELAFMDSGLNIPAYLDRNTGRVISIFEDDSLNEDKEIIHKFENDVAQERFIPFPAQYSREGWRQMERFINGLNDEHHQDVLYTAINGRGVFRRFKDALYRIDLIDEWYAFKNREERKDILDWLYSEDLIAEADTEKGMQMYERDLARRRRREQNLKKMVRGATVICSGNTGHVGQVTPGKTYDVLDEKKEHLTIRIKDDRDKVIWLPKLILSW